MNKQYTAWYSREQSKICGTVFYRDANGKEIECTCVSSDNDHHTNWKDIQCLGIVVEYLRQGRKGALDKIDSEDPQALLELAKEYSSPTYFPSINKKIDWKLN